MRLFQIILVLLVSLSLAMPCAAKKGRSKPFSAKPGKFRRIKPKKPTQVAPKKAETAQTKKPDSTPSEPVKEVHHHHHNESSTGGVSHLATGLAAGTAGYLLGSHESQDNTTDNPPDPIETETDASVGCDSGSGG